MSLFVVNIMLDTQNKLSVGLKLAVYMLNTGV